MDRLNRLGMLCLALVLMSFGLSQAQNGTVRGNVTDSENGEGLPGANVIIANPGETLPITGASTSIDGSFVIENVPAGTYDLIVRYVSYAEHSESITVTGGQATSVNISLASQGINLNQVVVTASRQAEKVLDAPASVTVLDAREIESQTTTTVASVLRNVPGVDIAQTGVDRFEVVMRGFNNAFSGSAHLLTDYRRAAAPSLNVNLYSTIPASKIDLESVEVVRGPGSALYGAGVDRGVIHMITKDPFTSPGTGVALFAGEKSTIGGEFRHANFTNNFGYKINGNYSQAQEWALDPNDPLDAIELSGDSKDRFTDVYKANIGGMMKIRTNDDTHFILNGGFNQFQATVQSGIGTLQADDAQFFFGQIRAQSGPLFAQFYLNGNTLGDSFTYGNGEIVTDDSKKMNGQVQYLLNAYDGRSRTVMGLDYLSTRPETAGTIYGRNEDNDTITEYGAYAQTTFAVSPKLDVTAALRADYNSVFEEVEFSPRAAFVIKPTPEHSFRGTYNRAYSSPGNNSLFLDIVAGALAGDPFPVLVRGRGVQDGYTWNRNSAYSGLFPGASDLVGTSILPIPGVYNTDTPAGMDLGVMYGLLFNQLNSLSLEEVNALLGVAVPPAFFQTLKDLLAPGSTNVEGWTPGSLGIVNPSDPSAAPRFVTDLTDIPSLKPTITNSFEVGYKGIINRKLLFAADFYYEAKKDFVGPLLVETPLVYILGLEQDLTDAIAAGLNADLLPLFAALGFTPEVVAATLAEQAALFVGDNPIAVIQPNENNSNGQPELMLAYRNFGKVTYYGADISFQYLLSNQVDIFGSASIVSDDFFDALELDEAADSGLQLALNAPKTKFKAGANYFRPNGLSANFSGRYVKGFPVTSGPYVGNVEDYFLLDVGFGYDLSNFLIGLRADVSIANVLNNERREFVGAPKIGRFSTIRLAYSL